MLGVNQVVKCDRVAWLWDQRCRSYLYPDQRALSFATSGSIRSLTEMEDAWRQFILGLI